MGKYSDKLVSKYIMGYEIDNIDELENSRTFMMLAIDKSNDFRLYNLCSDKLKKNYAFVKYLIYKFKANINFISQVADYFIENSNDDFAKTELTAIMSDLTIKDKEKYMRYRMFGHSIYYFKRLQIEAGKKEFDDEEFNEELGMGFLLIFEEYNHSKIVLDFYAKKIIDGIFDEFDIDLEYMLHEQFSDPNRIIKIGLNNFMLDFISYYDIMLANYLSVNINLMDDFRNRILRIIDNWEKYELKNEHDKYYLMFDKVHEYLLNNESLIDETSFIYYVGSKLGIANKILNYDSIYICSLDDVIKDIDFNFIKEALNTNFKERVYLNDIKKIMIETLFTKTNRETIDKKKILSINFRQERSKK